MSKISFQSSFNRKSSLFSLASKKFESDGFIDSTKRGRRFEKDLSRITPDIDFYSVDVMRSKASHDHQFTNFIKHSTDQAIKTGIFDILTNPGVIESSRAGEVEMKPEILACLNLYVNPMPQGAIVLKCNMTDSLGNPKSVRVFVLMILQSEPLKMIYRIILVDPFHLVIPSLHNGMTKDEMKRTMYNENRDNKICMYDYVQSIS
jgi:hypothetical protein